MASKAPLVPGLSPISELSLRNTVADLRLIIVSLALLAGCAGTITTDDGQALRIASPDFRDYLERVFREQNRLAMVLAFAQEESGGNDYERLVELEDDLLVACAALNELAAARRDDRTLSLRAQARLAATAPQCESTTRQAQRALDSL